MTLLTGGCTFASVPFRLDWFCFSSWYVINYFDTFEILVCNYNLHVFQFMPESARYYVSKGKIEKGEKVIKRIAWFNGKKPPSVSNSLFINHHRN